MKKIIITTDFSPAAMNAANYAVEFALAVEADILLFHSFQTPIINNEVPIILNYEDLIKTAEQELKQFESKLLQQVSNRLNVQSMVKMGSFFEELKIVSEQLKPYAVFMGSQGSTALENFLYGSHTVYAMRNLKWPVFAVSPQTTFSSIKKIGLASDFDHVIDSTPMQTIKHLVTDLKAALHVLNIGNKEKYNPDTIFESGMLQELLLDLNPVYHILDYEDVTEGILKFVDENKIDLLMIIPKHHNFVDALMNKHHTKKLVFKSHIPLVSLHGE